MPIMSAVTNQHRQVVCYAMSLKLSTRYCVEICGLGNSEHRITIPTYQGLKSAVGCVDSQNGTSNVALRKQLGIKLSGQSQAAQCDCNGREFCQWSQIVGNTSGIS